MPDTADTYQMPPHGWTCFFCGETFTTPGAAQDHFGSQPFEQAGCQIKAGEERGLLMALRKAEAKLAEVTAERDRARITVQAYNAVVSGRGNQKARLIADVVEAAKAVKMDWPFLVAAPPHGFWEDMEKLYATVTALNESREASSGTRTDDTATTPREKQ